MFLSNRSLVGAVVLIAVWAMLVVARVTAPSDLLDNDQMRPALYTLDVVRNGAWTVQRDVTGDIASKPPMYVWLASLVAHAHGEVTRVSLYAPTALAMLGSALLAWRAAMGRFGPRAGFWAGLAFLCSLFATKHMALARTDALFCLTVTLAALLGLRAWQGARWGWTVFWLACAAATLTKGPTGVLLASFGFIAVAWELLRTRTGPQEDRLPECACTRRLWADHLLGLACFFLITGGWFLLAWTSAGQPFIDKVIGKELVGHATRSIGGDRPFDGFHKPTLYFAAWFAPWCIATFAGLWTAFRRPARDAPTRRFERFIACWFLGGLALFSIAPHQRPDLLLPLIPAAAILAGREIDWWLMRAATGARVAIALAVVAVTLGGVTWHRHLARLNTVVVTQTRDLAELCAESRRLDPSARILDVDASFGFQYYMGVHAPRVGYEEAAAMLASDSPVIVGVQDGDRLATLSPGARLLGEAAGTSLFTNVRR